MKSQTFVVALLIILFVSACGSQTVATEQASTDTPAPPPSPTVLPSATPIPPTPTPEFQQYYTEEFDKDLKYWPTFIKNNRTGVIQKDPIDKVTLNTENGFFTFDIQGTRFDAYSIYDPFDYEDVRIDARMENLGTDEFYVGLVCRYSKEGGWYEFMITHSAYYIYFAKPREDGYVSYVRISVGESNKIKQDHEVNLFAIICKGDTLSLYINDNLTEEVKDTQLTSGKVGIFVRSGFSVPVKVNVDWVKISQP